MLAQRIGGRYAGGLLTSLLGDAAAVSNETQGRRARLLSSRDAHFAILSVGTFVVENHTVLNSLRIQTVALTWTDLVAAHRRSWTLNTRRNTKIEDYAIFQQ